jgi:hypothetical protein
MTTSEITEAIRRRFLDGDCASMATAISALTGWDLVVFTADGGDTGHVAAVHPDGGYVDVTGRFADWPHSAERPISVGYGDLDTMGWRDLVDENAIDEESYRYSPAAAEVARIARIVLGSL